MFFRCFWANYLSLIENPPDLARFWSSFLESLLAPVLWATEKRGQKQLILGVPPHMFCHCRAIFWTLGGFGRFWDFSGVQGYSSPGATFRSKARSRFWRLFSRSPSTLGNKFQSVTRIVLTSSVKSKPIHS